MTELEMKMTDWLATAIGLPDCFKNSDPGPGAGIIQTTASDSTFIAVLSARARAVSVRKQNSRFLFLILELKNSSESAGKNYGRCLKLKRYVDYNTFV
jgi:hypothetical protein